MKKEMALICFSLAAASSHAIVTFSTFGPGDTAGPVGWGFGDLSDTRAASQFTSSHTGSLDFIKMRVQAGGGNGIGTVSLFRDSGNDIGALMSVFTVDVTDGGLKTITNLNPNIQLVQGQKYWIEAKTPIGSGVYSGWNQNNQSIRGLLKFGAVNGSAGNTYNVGSNAILPAFSVGVQAVPEPSTLAAMGLFATFTALRRRRRS
jgi:hypothetical protein